MVAEGMTRGIPDLCLPVPRRDQGHIRFCGLYIEVKTRKGRITPEQRACHEFLRHNGYQVNTCRTVEEAITVIMLYIGNDYEF